MSFLDNAKQQAMQVKAMADAKVGDVQAKVKADHLLNQLGRLAYAEHTQRAGADSEAETAQVVAELKALEDAGTSILAEAPAGH